MAEQVFDTSEIGLLPSQRYEALTKTIPGFNLTLSALDQVALDQELSQKDTESLLAYSLWIENPEAQERISEVLRISPHQLRSHLDHVTDNLEDVWDELDTIQEELRETEATDGNPVPQTFTPTFTKTVNERSGRTTSFNLSLIDRETVLFGQLEEILNERELVVLHATHKGLDNATIGEKVGLSGESIPRVRSQVRKKIEDEILTPAGFFHLRRNGRRSQEVVVARDGSAEGVNILGRWYGTQEGAEVFDRRSRKVDDEMIEQGLEPVSWHVPWTPKNDHAWITKTGRKRGLLVKEGFRWYGRKEDIQALQAEREAFINSRS